MRNVKVAVTQMSCSWNTEETLVKADGLIRQAAEQGAKIILLQELFETPYFCQLQKFEYLELAKPPEENPAVNHFRKVARELDVVLPVSFLREPEIPSLIRLQSLMRMEKFLGYTGKHIYRTDCHMPKNFILHREIRDLRSGIPNTAGSVWEYAGISGFRRQQEVWHCLELKSCFFRPPLVQSRRLGRIPAYTGEMSWQDMQQPI